MTTVTVMMRVIIPTPTADEGPSRVLEGAPVAAEGSLVVGVGGADLRRTRTMSTTNAQV